jgi:hypothetical protein
MAKGLAIGIEKGFVVSEIKRQNAKVSERSKRSIY